MSHPTSCPVELFPCAKPPNSTSLEIMPDIAIEPDRRWTAVHTKARCEKIVAGYCDAHGIKHYLPLRRRAKRYQRRTVETYIPMFTGYMFVQIDDDDKQILGRSSKVAHILRIDAPGEMQLVRELQYIRQMEELSKQEELAVQPEIVPGKPVRVVSGPLQGTLGVVEARGSKLRVTVNVELLGQSVSAELDVGEVEVEEE